MGLGVSTGNKGLGLGFTQKRKLGGLYGYLTLKLKLSLDAGFGLHVLQVSMANDPPHNALKKAHLKSRMFFIFNLSLVA